ncbi:hypothetical protein [Massilia sp.]|uniref:hypothetical protein n=1 Tax=Massilia sp. TaxID=1882437 RepID=UPI00352C7F28
MSATFAIPQLYGKFQVTQDDAYDHASMRAKQLNALMQLMSDDGFEVFENLRVDTKRELMWFAQQLAEEVSTMIPIISANELPGKAELEVTA